MYTKNRQCQIHTYTYLHKQDGACHTLVTRHVSVRLSRGMFDLAFKYVACSSEHLELAQASSAMFFALSAATGARRGSGRRSCYLSDEVTIIRTASQALWRFRLENYLITTNARSHVHSTNPTSHLHTTNSAVIHHASTTN